MNYPRTRVHSLGVPTNPSPKHKSFKKNPPWLIKISTSKEALNSQKLIKTIQGEFLPSFSDLKSQNEALPPIKTYSKGRATKFRFFSPKFQTNYQNLRPLFTKKIKVDQSLNTRLDIWDAENSVTENTYKISVTTKKII